MTLPANLKEVTGLTVTIPDHVLFQQIEGEAVLLDVQTGGYFGLNGVGTFVWEQLSQTRTVRDVVSALREQYEISEERAVADTQAFLSALEAQHLINFNEQAS